MCLGVVLSGPEKVLTCGKPYLALGGSSSTDSEGYLRPGDCLTCPVFIFPRDSVSSADWLIAI